MATNDFWRRLSRELTDVEIEAGLYINPLLFHGFLFDVASGGGATLAQARVSLNLAAGTSAGDEFKDLIDTAANLPGTGLAKRAVQRQVLQGIVSAATVAGRGSKLPSNPYPTGNSLRLRAREILVQEGATPLVGTMSPST
jgi:hypothetical protein